MYFLILRHDHPACEALRIQLKQEHRSFLASLGPALLTAGALLADDGETVVGGTIIVAADTLEAAQAIAAADPYAQHAEIMQSCTVMAYRCRWKDGVFSEAGFTPPH